MINYTKTGKHRYQIIDLKRGKVFSRNLSHKKIITYLLEYGYLFSGVKENIIETKKRYRRKLNTFSFLAIGKYGYILDHVNLNTIGDINTIVLDKYDTNYQWMSPYLEKKLAPFLRKEKLEKIIKDIDE